MLHWRSLRRMSALILNADGTAPPVGAASVELAGLWVAAAGGALVARERLPWDWIRGQIGGLVATTLVRCPSARLPVPHAKTCRRPASTAPP